MMARIRARADRAGDGDERQIAPQHVHLVGAGGIHMSAIGQILLQRGHAVTGSDLVLTEYTERLEALGGTVFRGHDAANLGEAELVVATAAAKPENPEIAEARRRGVPVILRAEMVQRLLEGRLLLAVAGSHGKTTTSSLLALMCERGGLEPLVLLGGDSRELGGNAQDGGGAYAVVEADEYAEAFLQYHPQIALVLNVERDHLDYYGTEERLRAAFVAFAERLVPDGTLVVCADAEGSNALGEARRAAGTRVERYSIASKSASGSAAEWRAEQLRVNDRGGYDFTASLEGAELGRISLQVPGRHNVSNALGALAVAMRAGVDFNRAALAASEFTGARRRFDVLGEAAGVAVVDDYSHHPTEVRAMIAAARQRYGSRRLVVCFQPHTYTRTQYLLDEWRTCFEGADALYLVRTYAARETADAGLDAGALASEIVSPAATLLEDFEAAPRALADALRPGDVLVTVGAGDVTEIGPRVLELLRAGGAS